MMTGIMISGMQIEHAVRRLFEFMEARRTEEGGSQPDADQHAGGQNEEARRPSRPSQYVHEPKRVEHKPPYFTKCW